MNVNCYDIIVVGGGTTGCCAAISAAELGAKVLIVEKLPFLGGNMTGGLPWLGFHDKASRRKVVGGLPMRIIKTLQKANGATDFIFDPITGSAVGVNGNMLKLVIEKMAVDAGVDILLHSIVSEVEERDGFKLLGVTTKGGLLRFSAKVVIDCTDSADACELAGARLVIGRESDHRTQVSSYVEMFGGIDYREMLEYFQRNTDQIRPFPLSEEERSNLLLQMETAPIWVLGAFPKIIAKAQEDGLKYGRKQLIGVAYTRTNELMLVSSRVEDVDLNDAAKHSRAEIDGFQQTWDILKLLQNYIPGCQNAHLVNTGAQLGIRESRHVIGDYILTAEDMLRGKSFDDSICCGAYHMDIHSPDHNGLETKQPPIYSIPYRSLLVSGMDNVMVAGRCISATHEAMSSTRVAPISAAEGEAAGVAAAIAVQLGKSTREVPIGMLQAELSQRNVIYETGGKINE